MAGRDLLFHAIFAEGPTPVFASIGWLLFFANFLFPSCWLRPVITPYEEIYILILDSSWAYVPWAKFLHKDGYSMLYMVGTLREVDQFESKLPCSVFTELVRGIAILDYEYGENRNYREDGGYSLIAETAEDVQEVKKYVDYESHLCEWVTSIGKDSGYLSALFIMSNDFSIMLYLPSAVAPDVLLEEVEE